MSNTENPAGPCGSPLTEGLGPIDRHTIDCWREKYRLDKTPHDLHALWHAWAPPGAMLALKAAIREVDRLRATLAYAEDALADIGDADREPGDDVAWCETRAAEALPRVRAHLGALGPNVRANQPARGPLE